jgi:hypothetical protein
MINFKDISSLNKSFGKKKKSLNSLLNFYDICGCICSCCIGRYILIKYKTLVNIGNSMIIYYEDIAKKFKDNSVNEWKQNVLDVLNLYKIKLEERNLLVSDYLVPKESISLM